jgi:hypothetical protein
LIKISQVASIFSVGGRRPVRVKRMTEENFFELASEFALSIDRTEQLQESNGTTSGEI